MIQGETFNSSTPAAALELVQEARRATKIKTPYVRGAARPEYRGFGESWSIDYPALLNRFVGILIELVALDIALNGAGHQIIDWQIL